MNKEKMNQIIDEVYENYQNKRSFANKDNVRIPHTLSNGMTGQISRPFAKEEFINKCKTDQEFSERWGLKIEERELSLEERNFSLGNDRAYKGLFGFNERDDLEYKEKFDSEKRPTKLIAITYNNETIKFYE